MTQAINTENTSSFMANIPEKESELEEGSPEGKPNTPVHLALPWSPDFLEFGTNRKVL